MTIESAGNIFGFNFSSFITDAYFSIAPSAIHVISALVTAVFILFSDARFFPVYQQSAFVVDTAVVDVTLYGAVLNGTMLFSYSPANFTSSYLYECVFFANDNTWSTTGLTTVVDPTRVDCTSSHLTNFAVLVVGHMLFCIGSQTAHL